MNLRRVLAVGAALGIALSVQPQAASAQSKTAKSSLSQPRDAGALKAWGPMAALPGRYWLLTNRSPQLYVTFRWEAPGRVLIFEGRDRAGNIVAGRYERDPEIGQIGGVTLTKGLATLSRISLSQDSYVEEAEERGVLQRQTYTRVDASRFDVSLHTLRKGKWEPGASLSLVAVPESLITALAWERGSEEPAPSGGFLRELGDALKAGALRGVADGIHEGVRDGLRDRTQSAIAGKKAVPRE